MLTDKVNQLKFSNADGLQSRKIDFLLKAEPILDEPWLLRTTPFTTEKTRFGHLIREERGAFFDLMNNFKVGISLLFIYLGALLALLLIGICIRRLAYWTRFGTSRKPNLSRGYFADRKLGFKRFPALAIFILFVGVFLWLTQLFLINNIKVDV